MRRQESRKLERLPSEPVRVLNDLVKTHKKATQNPKSMPDYKGLEASATSAMATQTKLQFFQDAADEDDADAVASATRHQHLAPGTFVEVRRNSVASHGVILRSEDAQSGSFVTSLSSTGEVWSHVYQDIMFAVPRLVNRPTVAMAIGALSEDGAVQGMDDSPKTIAARVAILKEIRAVEKEVETNYHRITLKIHRVLETAPWANSSDWTAIATEDLVRAIGEKGTVAHLCVHKFLMATHERFIAYSTNFLTAQRFWVRPRQLTEDLEEVTKMLSLRAPALESFYAKAKQRLAAYQERPASSPAVRVDTSTAFTPEEQTILRVLRDFVRTSRSIQKDTYVVPVATIIKRMDLTDKKIDHAFVHNLLIQLGVVTPWDDPIVQERKLLLIPSAKTIAPPPTSTSSGSNLSPEEYYPHDIAEHVRHDFKDLPAFVIDDEGAQELDDAVSVEPIPSEPGSHWLHVHIADPTLKIHPNHFIAREARYRYTTAYDVHNTEPMIPSSFMYDGLSLGTNMQKGLPEHVLTFSSKVTAEGAITDYKVQAGLLRNVHIVRYDEVDRLMGLPPRPPAYPFEPPKNKSLSQEPHALAPAQVQQLRALHDVSSRLIKSRVAAGKFAFGTPSAQISMHPQPPPPNPKDWTHPSIFEGFPQLKYTVDGTADYGARQMVSEAMKAACRVASRFCRDHDLPAVRRTSGAPSGTDDALAQMLSLRSPDGHVDLQDVLRLGLTFPAAVNELSAKGHWILDVPDGEGYVRVTSPLRRYADLVTHWQIKHALAAGGAPRQPLFSTAWLAAFAAEMTEKEAALRTLERRHRTFWALRYIDRWRADPRNAGRPSALDTMHALAIRSTNADNMTRLTKTRVLVPELGVPAFLEMSSAELAQRPAAGERVPVKFGSIRLGTKPELLVHLRKD
ncbi:RNB domain-containing protein [Phanerochaete sordida]|uniref:RNB domain-containing protein n=1 Tax=Phanerochaete sordida TaxID=48140 RepID=A0A9P3GGY0_9APHY|nr:RNB domain-containing protein [Phanerochaete sordida]